MVVTWQTPTATDNVAVASIYSSMESGANLTAGTYTVIAYATDSSGNIATPCSFTVIVYPAPTVPPSTQAPPAAASSSSSTVVGAAGAGGCVAILVLVILIIVLLRRRRNPNQVHGTGERPMSDDEILAKAQSIQLDFKAQRVVEEPTMAWMDTPAVVYKSPPSDAKDFGAFFARTVPRELARGCITLDREIGKGEFGSVFSGKIRRADGQEKVIAVKTLVKANHEPSKIAFLQEAAILAQFNHPKIVKLVGVVTVSEPILLCLEFMEFGSLLSYLTSSMVGNNLPDVDMLRMACDVASAMHYLGESGFIHRDLAARNVLVNRKFVAKVSDFGLSQEVGAASKKTDKIPLRWTAMEAVLHRRFSTSSDVWSYGVLLWEIWSYGALPYGAKTNDRILADLNAGIRLSMPKKCPQPVYNIMLECWSQDTTDRPTFYTIFQRLMTLHAAKVKVAKESGEELYASPAELKKNDDDNFSPDMLLYDEPITSSSRAIQNGQLGSAYNSLARALSTRSNASQQSQYNSLQRTVTNPGFTPQASEYPSDLYLSDVESVPRAVKPAAASPVQSSYQQEMYIDDLVEVPQPATSSRVEQASYQQEMYIDDLVEAPTKLQSASEPTAVEILTKNVETWDPSLAYTMSEQSWVPSFTPAQTVDTNETFGFEDGQAGGYLNIDSN